MFFAPRLRGALWFASVLGMVACGSSSEPSPDTKPAAVSIVSGNGQVGLVGQTLSLPLTIKVLSSSSTPLSGVSVTFAVTSGTASVSPSTTATDASGQAQTSVTFGSSPGNVTVTASVAGTSLVATFALTAGAGNTTVACQTSSPQALGAGAVLPGVGGTGICLSGGTTGAEFALVAFDADPNNLNTTNLTVTGAGATAVTTPNVLPNFDVAGTELLGGADVNTAQAAFDRTLRETARRELTPLMPAARAFMRRRTAAAATIPANPTIGSLVTLNANGLQACTQIKSITARVAAVSSGAIVVADTANPSGGFTDAEYLSFATMFDTLIDAVDTTAFGDPTDIDKNGKIVIFFTKEVNALTPKTGTGGTIGGFFFERDLFPLQDTNNLQGCAGSNFAEMFYVLVPDPTGVYSKTHTKDDVLRVTPGTIAHEYQHLINAGRRLYVNNASDFEETWLNEGLSHVAEELLFYRVSGLAPRQNIGISQLNSQPLVDAFNNYQVDNLARFEVFLGKPSRTSVYGANDSLETRGATWNLLRYLADHRGASDADTWSRLVNTPLTGQSNLAAVFGSDYLTQIRDWATSVFTDDVAGVTDAKYLEPSWNHRSIFPQLCADSQCSTRLGRYPLTVVPLSSTSPASLTINAGGVAYLRFSVSGGGQASIDWSSAGLPVSPLMQLTVVRTK